MYRHKRNATSELHSRMRAVSHDFVLLMIEKVASAVAADGPFRQLVSTTFDRTSHGAASWR